jgi:Sulfotransferase domain
MPDHFVIVGAQRSGTTYLYGLLDEHPEIEMAKPLRPEPKFFLDYDRYALGLDAYESQLFSDARTRVRGEKSTSYIESDVAARRIAAMLPDAPVIAVVRDPVRRAMSNYLFSVKHGVEDLGPAEAIHGAATGDRGWDHTRFSVSPFDYLARGRYIDYLERFAAHVARDRMHVLVFEELVSDSTVVANLYEHLGVDAAFRPLGIGTAVNAADDAGKPPEPDLETWMREYFRESNERLEKFLDRSLPWPA